MTKLFFHFAVKFISAATILAGLLCVGSLANASNDNQKAPPPQKQIPAAKPTPTSQRRSGSQTGSSRPKTGSSR